MSVDVDYKVELPNPLVAGKYETRDGRIVEITQPWPDARIRTGRFDNGQLGFWLPNGQSGDCSDWDLVARIR